MAFIETQINSGLIVYETVGGPGTLTTVIETYSGREQRNQNWLRPRGKWELGERLVTSGELAAMLQFFRAVHGKLDGFRFKDWADYQATAANGILGTGVATAATNYQLRKVYTVSSLSEVRDILKPVTPIAVYVNAVLKVAGTDYSVNSTTGVVSFIIQPPVGAALTWSGAFDVPARFDVDELRSRFDAYDKVGGESLHYLYTLPIIELLDG